MKIIGKTMIGSHIWKMNNKDSDEDYFEIYMESTEDIFKGTAKYKSKFNQNDGIDTHQHELGHVINQLLKGNINFIIGITSPILVETNEHFDELRNLTFRNLSKNVYYSIRGMSEGNYKKYVLAEKDTSTRKCNQILRTIEFGIKILKYRQIEYLPFKRGTPKLIEKKIKELEDAYTNSTIPEKPDEDELRNYLSKMRKIDWWNNLKVN